MIINMHMDQVAFDVLSGGTVAIEVYSHTRNLKLCISYFPFALLQLVIFPFFPILKQSENIHLFFFTSDHQNVLINVCPIFFFLVFPKQIADTVQCEIFSWDSLVTISDHSSFSIFHHVKPCGYFLPIFQFAFSFLLHFLIAAAHCTPYFGLYWLWIPPSRCLSSTLVQ